MIVFLALLLPTIPRQGINFDEQSDLDVTTEYVRKPSGLIFGSPLDAINTRLPMYTVAVVFTLAGTIDLRLARLLSAGVSVLTLVAVFVYCRRWLDPVKAAAACLLLGTSPYFLAFAGCAFTEGDVFITCATAWVLVSASALVDRASIGRAVVAGAALGLAMSSKISGAFLFPAVVAAVALAPSTDDATRLRLRDREVRPLIATAAVLLIWVLFVAAKARIVPPWLFRALESSPGRPELLYLALLAIGGAVLAWAWRRRHRLASHGMVTTVIGVTAAVTFFAIPPVHTTNGHVLGSLWRQAISGGAGIDPAFVAEALALHVAVILLKPGVVVGIGLWLGLIVAAFRARQRPELRLPVLMALFYLGFLLTLPWAQPFYMMPLLPILGILAADALVDLFRVRRRIAAAVVAAAVISVAWDMVACYPDLSLNGYQWVGERYLAGRSTLGYRSIAQVRSDGEQQVLQWANQHVVPGETVVLFLSSPRIIRATSPNPSFRLVNGMRRPGALDEADWVLTAINADIMGGYNSSLLGSHGDDNPEGTIFRPRYDRAQLEAEFAKVFAVRRAFDIEVAAVWRRR